MRNMLLIISCFIISCQKNPELVTTKNILGDTLTFSWFDRELSLKVNQENKFNIIESDYYFAKLLDTTNNLEIDIYISPTNNPHEFYITQLSPCYNGDSSLVISYVPQILNEYSFINLIIFSITENNSYIKKNMYYTFKNGRVSIYIAKTVSGIEGDLEGLYEHLKVVDNICLIKYDSLNVESYKLWVNE